MAKLGCAIACYAMQLPHINRASGFLWAVDSSTGTASAKNYDPLRRPRRQDWDGELIENGQNKLCIARIQYIRYHTIVYHII